MQKANERRKNEEKYTWRKIQICANRSNGGEELISAEHLEKAWTKENLQKQCNVSF